MELMQNIKERWQRYLKGMAKANEEMWKGKKPGCCDDSKKKEEEPKDERR